MKPIHLAAAVALLLGCTSGNKPQGGTDAPPPPPKATLKLRYTDPAPNGGWRIVKLPLSTDTRPVLALVGPGYEVRAVAITGAWDARLNQEDVETYPGAPSVLLRSGTQQGIVATTTQGIKSSEYLQAWAFTLKGPESGAITFGATRLFIVDINGNSSEAMVSVGKLEAAE